MDSMKPDAFRWMLYIPDASLKKRYVCFEDLRGCKTGTSQRILAVLLFVSLVTLAAGGFGIITPLWYDMLSSKDLRRWEENLRACGVGKEDTRGLYDIRCQ